MTTRYEWTYAYAPIGLIDEYLRLGWYPHNSFEGCERHGQYAVLVEWLCQCDLPPLPSSLSAHPTPESPNSSYTAPAQPR